MRNLGGRLSTTLMTRAMKKLSPPPRTHLHDFTSDLTRHSWTSQDSPSLPRTHSGDLPSTSPTHLDLLRITSTTSLLQRYPLPQNNLEPSERTTDRPITCPLIPERPQLDSLRRIRTHLGSLSRPPDLSSTSTRRNELNLRSEGLQRRSPYWKERMPRPSSPRPPAWDYVNSELQDQLRPSSVSITDGLITRSLIPERSLRTMVNSTTSLGFCLSTTVTLTHS